MQTKTHSFVIGILMLATFISCKKDISDGDDLVPETLPAIQTAVSKTINANCAGYYQALPARYDSSSKKYPLIVFIHGIGELGNGTTDLKNMLRAGLPKLINKKGFPPDFVVGGKHFSFVVISPQFKNWPGPDDVHGVVQYAKKNFRIDTTRIYVTGLSMGGGVTWEYSAKYGASLAAVVPICGGSSPDNKRAQQIASFNLPVWAFHNEDDATVPVSFTRDYVSKINSHKPAVLAKATIWATGGHDSWTKAYDPAYKENGLNMYAWMLGYKYRGTSK